MKVAVTVLFIIILLLIGVCITLAKDLLSEKVELAEYRDGTKIIVQQSSWEWGNDWHILTSDGKGFVRLYIDVDEGENIICDLFVDPEYRRQGYADMLLDECDKILDGRPVKVVPKEFWMKDWYEKRGYEIIEK